MVVVDPLEVGRVLHSFGKIEMDLAAVKRRKGFQVEAVPEGGGALLAVVVL